MSLYLDASVLVALFVQEQASPQAQSRLAGEALIISDFAAAEFSAAVARRVRMGDIPGADASIIFAALDDWTTLMGAGVAVQPHDMRAANVLVRRLELGLRAPDALHIAMTQRLSATLFTFDAKMAAAAQQLGVPLAG